MTSKKISNVTIRHDLCLVGFLRRDSKVKHFLKTFPSELFYLINTFYILLPPFTKYNKSENTKGKPCIINNGFTLSSKNEIKNERLTCFFINSFILKPNRDLK